jgi:hypothetical protein
MAGGDAKELFPQDAEKMSDHQSAPKFGKRVGEFLILGLYLAVDAAELWHRSHFWALFAAWFGVLALLLLDGGFSRKAMGVIASTAAIFCAVVYFVAPPELSEETETHGILLPASEPTPRNGRGILGVQIPDNAILFIAGANGAWTTSQGKSQVLKIGEVTVLSVERTGNDLAFDAEIFDEKGELVVRIIKDEFHLIAGKYSYRDRSGDRSKITVYDSKGAEMLYINRANPKTVIVRSVFNTPDGLTVRATDDEILLLPNYNGIAQTGKAGFGGNRAGFTFTRKGIAF